METPFHPGDDPYVRIDALEALREQGDLSGLASAAAEALTDADAGVREYAAGVLTELSTWDAAAQVAPHIASRDITVRNLAGEVLSQMGMAAVAALRHYIDDEDYDVRKFAIDVLAMLPAQQLCAQIAGRLSDSDANVVLAAVDALGALGGIVYADDLRDLYEREPLARPNVATALGALRRADDLLFLEDALADEDFSVQFSAAEALAAWDAPEVLDLLLRKVNDVHPMAQPVVLASLIRYCAENPDHAARLPFETRDALLEMLADSDDVYRRTAVAGLTYFLDGEVVDALLSQTGQDDALDLEIFTTVAAYPALLDAIIDGEAAGRVPTAAAANFALGMVMQQLAPEYDWERIGAFLVARFDALDPDTQMGALSLAQQLRHAAFVPVVEHACSHVDPSVSLFASETAHDLGIVHPAA